MTTQPGQLIAPLQSGLQPIDTGGARVASLQLTQGSFTLTGATPVTVVAPNITGSSDVNITLKTVGGTVGAAPTIQTITPGTGFTIQGSAGDTSVYNYLITG